MTIPPHLRHVVTLPWETKSSNFLQIWMKTQTDGIFNRISVMRAHILIFSVFKTASLSPYWLQIRFCASLFFCLFTFIINLCPHWRKRWTV